MDITGTSALVTGGASGLGLATVRALVDRGVNVVMLDLDGSSGAKKCEELGPLAHFSQGDVTDPISVGAALDNAQALGPIRALVHCAGKGGTVRVVERDGSPGSLETYESLVRLNLVGTFNVLSLSAARMAEQEPVGEERGVCILTASVAAWEGQIGQIPYASAKAGAVSYTHLRAHET